LHPSAPDEIPPELPSDNVLIAPYGGLTTDVTDTQHVSGSGPRLRRNRICIVIMACGVLNLLAYTVSYAILGGDAYNGWRERGTLTDGTPMSVYYLRGHFVHSLDGRVRTVSRAMWIYSYVHSISVPLTSGAMIISMLILVRPHILATMRGGVINGRTFVIAFGAIVALISVAVAANFTWQLIQALGG
jgi:hypothetical protein